MSDNLMIDKVRAQFVGRQDALDAFYNLFASGHMKNGIYYFGGGGLGKTWILWKLLDDNQDDALREVTPIIDFYDTKNHSVRGLQATIKERLGNPPAFEPYDQALERLQEAQSNPDTPPSAIANLEVRVNRVFIQCCNDAIVGREVVALFDTFERVQQHYVGRWLCEDFFRGVKDLRVAIVGRPEPTPASMPDNIQRFPLGELDIQAFGDLLSRLLPSPSGETVETIWKHTKGNPLITHLIKDLGEPARDDFITRLGQMGETQLVQESRELLKWLVRRFTEPDNRNRVIWAMAYLRRRLDEPILKHIVMEMGKWFHPDDYDKILVDLRKLPYLKDYPSIESYLLHDEIQRIVRDFALPLVDGGEWEEFRSDLYEKIVNVYYLQTIKTLEEINLERTSGNVELARQLRSEQLGYILDEDPELGLEKYVSYRNEVEVQTQDYDFEELLWSEVREHLDRWDEEKGYSICRERGEWLSKHSLFQKAAEHYSQMLDRFRIRKVETQLDLGFMLLRQREIPEAIAVVESSRLEVKEGDFEIIADIENILGQATRLAGQLDQSLEHYGRSFTAALNAQDRLAIANVYINRGYLYSIKGNYEEAKKQCEQAIDLVTSLPPTTHSEQSAIYAWMNLGTAFRHSGDYATAAQHYRKSLELVSPGKNDQAVSNIKQHMGINEHLWGRMLRREGKELAEACEHQRQAWRHLTEAIEIALRSGWRNAIAEGLNRLGKVYREIYRLQTVPLHVGAGMKGLPSLVKEAQNYQPPFEAEYEDDLLTSNLFAEASWLEKAARLFEISALIAYEENDIHRALESWTEAAHLFEELDMIDKVLLVIRRIERIKAHDFEEALFQSISELILADLDFKQENLNRALEMYAKAYADLAEQSGYATYVLSDRLRDLEWRLLTLPRNTALDWCDFLEQEWTRRSVLAKRPEMRDTLERIRIKVMWQ